MTDSIFGNITADDQIEDAVIDILRKWLPTYMSEVERQLDLAPGFYSRPFHSSYIVRTDFDHWPEEMLPAVTAISVGVEDDPRKDGRGRYRAKYAIGLANVCISNDSVYVRRYAARMGAAIRAVMIQHQSLDGALSGAVRGITFVGSRNNLLPSSDERTIRAYRQLFVVEVDDVVTRGMGPAAPDADPPADSTQPVPDWPTVETVLVAKEPLDA